MSHHHRIILVTAQVVGLDPPLSRRGAAMLRLQVRFFFSVEKLCDFDVAAQIFLILIDISSDSTIRHPFQVIYGQCVKYSLRSHGKCGHHT
jgi:hypothetical protein